MKSNKECAEILDYEKHYYVPLDDADAYTFDAQFLEAIEAIREEQRKACAEIFSLKASNDDWDDMYTAILNAGQGE